MSLFFFFLELHTTGDKKHNAQGPLRIMGFFILSIVALWELHDKMFLYMEAYVNVSIYFCCEMTLWINQDSTGGCPTKQKERNSRSVTEINGQE